MSSFTKNYFERMYDFYNFLDYPIKILTRPLRISFDTASKQREQFFENFILK